MPSLRAVLYVPRGSEMLRWLGQLTDWTLKHGWRPLSYTSSWTELVALCASGQRELGVVATRGHLPPDRLPRLVVADELPAETSRPRWRR